MMGGAHVHEAAGAELERGRRDPRTLRFLDPELERAYQDETTPPLRQPRRRAFVTDAPLWLAGGIAGASVATALPFQILLLFLVLGLTCWGTYISENRERTVFASRRLIAELHRRVNALFHQYLSPDVADVLLEHPDRAELGGEVVEV